MRCQWVWHHLGKSSPTKDCTWLAKEMHCNQTITCRDAWHGHHARHISALCVKLVAAQPNLATPMQRTDGPFFLKEHDESTRVKAMARSLKTPDSGLGPGLYESAPQSYYHHTPQVAIGKPARRVCQFQLGSSQAHLHTVVMQWWGRQGTCTHINS